MVLRPRDEIVRGRHIDYTSSGVPIIVQKHSDICKEQRVDFPEGRHIDYTADGVPITALSTRCCKFLTDLRVGTACWPPVGIAPRVWAVMYNAINCATASLREAELTYDSVLQIWEGIITGLRGGDITLQWWCDDGALWLHWEGCGQEGLLSSIPECTDPLIVNYQFEPTNCCCCPRTETGAQVNLRVYANCYPMIFGRHIGYVGEYPLIASDSCPVAKGRVACSTMTCGLQAVLTAVDSECACMEDTYNLSYVGGLWEDSKTKCSLPVTINMECLSDTGTDTELSTFTGTGTCFSDRALRFRMTVVCGANNTGTTDVLVNICNLEDFDEVFDITMFSSSGTGCTGDCTWQWNEMALAWSKITPCADPGCDCATPPGDGVSGAGSGVLDGETTTTPCTGPEADICCNGRIQVRVTRDCGTGT